MKNLIAAAVLFPAVVAQAAFTVSHVTVQQRWPWSGKVDIDYVLESDDGELADVEVVLFDGETPLNAPVSAFSGDVRKVASGFRRITFDPTAAGLPAATYSSVRAVLSTHPSDAPYLIVDLTKAKGDPGLVTYVTEKDLASGAYGAVATNLVSGIASIAWTGVTNDSAYATTKYVMRRIPAGSFMMGANNKAYNKNFNVRTNQVTLTRDFYIGVFETTQRQWELVMGSNPSYFTKNGATRPVEHITYAMVRGENASWPTDGYGAADANSFLGKMCDLTGLTFDLPTFAQNQYASGYTLETWFNTGKNQSSVGSDNCPAADECARYPHTVQTALPSSGTIDYASYDVDSATAKVGSYACNAFGLYDMHGNVWEFLLDYSSSEYDYPEVCVDPTGPTTGTNRMWAGGSFQRDSRYCRLAFRGGYDAKPKHTAEVYLRESGFRAIMMP